MVLQLFPESEWSVSLDQQQLLGESDSEEDTPDIDADDVSEPSSSTGGIRRSVRGGAGTSTRTRRPSGRVRAVLQRTVEEVVATVPLLDHRPRCDEQRLHEGSETTCSVDGGPLFRPEKDEYVLVNPMDRRLPNIRIRTRQVR